MVSIRRAAKLAYKRIILSLFVNQNPILLFFYRYMYVPKKDGISGFTDQYSRNHKNISVVQIGANDGYHHDPIFKFIFRDGWKGVLLEPQPMVFPELLRLHHKNPNIIPVNAALDHKDSQRVLYSLAVNERWAHGRASFSREIVSEAIDSGFLESKAAKEGAQLPDNRADWIKEFTIDCLSPETLMNRYNIERIDWLQIDTEGYDFEIIKMFDLSKTKPSIISYEHSHLSQADMSACDEHLVSNDYVIKRYGGNTIAEKSQ